VNGFRWLTWLGVLIAIVLGVALYWENEGGTLAPVSWSVAIAAIATFFVFLYAFAPNKTPTKTAFRNALTATFTVTYFILLGLFVFFHSDSDPSSISTTLVTNFTFLMGVVIAFHFGTTAYETAAQVKAAAENPSGKDAIESAVKTSETQGTVAGT
jgi:hypothetical protein